MTTTDTPALISYDLPSEIEAEIQNYEAHVRRFQRDEIAPLDFRIFRLQHGIYGQRQPDVHMVRVKIAYGGLNSEQLEILAEIAERYAPRQMGHITTRARPPDALREVDGHPHSDAHAGIGGPDHTGSVWQHGAQRHRRSSLRCRGG